MVRWQLLGGCHVPLSSQSHMAMLVLIGLSRYICRKLKEENAVMRKHHKLPTSALSTLPRYPGRYVGTGSPRAAQANLTPLQCTRCFMLSSLGLRLAQYWAPGPFTDRTYRT